MQKVVQLKRTAVPPTIPVRQQVQLQTTSSHLEQIIIKFGEELDYLEKTCSEETQSQVQDIQSKIRMYCQIKENEKTFVTRALKIEFSTFYSMYNDLYETTHYIEKLNHINAFNLSSYDDFKSQMFKLQELNSLYNKLVQDSQNMGLGTNFSDISEFLKEIRNKLMDQDEPFVIQKFQLVQRGILDDTMEKEQIDAKQRERSQNYQKLLEKQEIQNQQFSLQQHQIKGYQALIERINVVLPGFYQQVEELFTVYYNLFCYVRLIDQLQLSYNGLTPLSKPLLIDFLSSNQDTEFGQVIQIIAQDIPDSDDLAHSLFQSRQVNPFQQEFSQKFATITDLVANKMDYFTSNLRDELGDFPTKLKEYLEFTTQPGFLKQEDLQKLQYQIDICGEELKRSQEAFKQLRFQMEEVKKNGSLENVQNQCQEELKRLEICLKFAEKHPELVQNLKFVLQFAPFAESYAQFSELKLILGALFKFNESARAAVAEIDADLRASFPGFSDPIENLKQICGVEQSQQVQGRTVVHFQDDSETESNVVKTEQFATKSESQLEAYLPNLLSNEEQQCQSTGVFKLQSTMERVNEIIESGWAHEHYFQKLRPALIAALKQGEGAFQGKEELLHKLNESFKNAQQKIKMAQNEAKAKFQNLQKEVQQFGRMNKNRELDHLAEQKLIMKGQFHIFHLQNTDEYPELIDYQTLVVSEGDTVISFDREHDRFEESEIPIDRFQISAADLQTKKSIVKIDDLNNQQQSNNMLLSEFQQTNLKEFQQMRWAPAKHCKIPYEINVASTVFIKTLTLEMLKQKPIQYIKKGGKLPYTAIIYLDKSLSKFYIRIRNSTTVSTTYISKLDQVDLGVPLYAKQQKVFGCELQVLIENQDPMVIFFLNEVDRDTWLTGLQMLTRFINKLQVIQMLLQFD